MKTTIDLPDQLVVQVKLRAVREHRKLKDMVAVLLTEGLNSRENRQDEYEKPGLVTDELTGLLVARGGHPAAPGDELTPARINELLLAQDSELHENPR